MLTPTTKLSPREAQIAGLIAAGYTDWQIAEHLRVSYYTVRAHLRNIHNKSGTFNRAQLAVKMYRYCNST